MYIIEVRRDTEKESDEIIEDLFKCQGCGCEVPMSFSLRTDGYCYLCDPNITVQELLSDKPILKSPATDGHE